MRYYYLASSILMTDLVLYSLSVCLEKKGGQRWKIYELMGGGGIRHFREDKKVHVFLSISLQN